MKKLKNTIIITICLLQYINVFGQLSTNERPVSFGLQNISAKSLAAGANKMMPSLNMTSIKQEDEKDEANGLPPKFEYPYLVNKSECRNIFYTHNIYMLFFSYLCILVI